MKNIIYYLVQLASIILLSPLVNGIIKKLKAFTQKRKGAPILQMYYDLYKLFRKNSVVSEVTSWIFKVTPYIFVSTSIIAGFLVPITTLVKPNSFPGDFIMLISILALGRFFMVLAGLDAGSTFGGMGSSREVMISVLIEPAIFVSFFTLGLYAKSTSIYNIMLEAKKIGIPLLHPMFIMIFLAMLIIIISETSRIPVDDPSTHLELTMVHEAMLLEYSGRHLALMELGAAIKQLIYITLIVNIFLPTDQLIGNFGIASIFISILIYAIKVIAVSTLIAIGEVSTVKLSLFSIPNLAALSFILSFLGFLQFFVLGR
ncbi:MAG TPA: NADH-quinone oxidoreductase subunit H [Clostridiaceae bacterium]